MAITKHFTFKANVSKRHFLTIHTSKLDLQTKSYRNPKPIQTKRWLQSGNFENVF